MRTDADFRDVGEARGRGGFFEQLQRLSGPDSRASRVCKDLVTRGTGRFYTPSLVLDHLVRATLRAYRSGEDGVVRVVEPFCGDGRLICRFLEGAAAGAKRSRLRWDIHLWDCDSKAVEAARADVARVVRRLGLAASIHASVTDSFALAQEYFGSFDVCLTNPPWELLKPDKRELGHLGSKEVGDYVELLARRDRILTRMYPRSSPGRKFSGWGTNLARCGLEAALRLVRPGGVGGIVSPASFLADQISESLRRWVFTEHGIEDIAYYAAEARLFDGVDQPCMTLLVRREGRRRAPPRMTVYSRERTATPVLINRGEWEATLEDGCAVPLHIGGAALRLRARLRGLPRFADLEREGCDSLWAGRELDETRHEEYLTDCGDYRFVKGRMVHRFELIEGPARFVRRSGPRIPESADHWRIGWRDVSRPNQKRRVQAALIPPGVVTGNSLGVAYYRGGDPARIRALLAVMNSAVFELQVRGLLATGHVSLWAVRQARVPRLDEERFVAALASLVDRRAGGDKEAEADAEAMVAQAYGLSIREFESVLGCFPKVTQEERRAMLDRDRWRAPGNRPPRPREGVDPAPRIANHACTSLSELDLRIARAVPPGGNWKDLPLDLPSARVRQIRTSYAAGNGSRSTYYGRLRPDAPAYTINTYYTRPGNGCHIHYDHRNGQHRTLSHREAARLQTFPDSFRFSGSGGRVAQQIGNAVPPLLAYQIALAIPGPGVIVDLFCGAGGLALGFAWAGWRCIVANDIDPLAVATYRANLQGQVIEGDLREKAVFAAVLEACARERGHATGIPLLVCGGPPCQGFSTAGNKRSMSDGRNWLFRRFTSLLRAIQPDGFVFENVPGILNACDGRLFRMVRGELARCARSTCLWKLRAEEYGVPQRRTRVIFVGDTRLGVNPAPPRPLTGFGEGPGGSEPLPPAINVEEALGDLPPLSPGEDGSRRDYRSEPVGPFQELMRGRITPGEYLARLASRGRPRGQRSLLVARR